MSETLDLNEQEKVFLAGAIKILILLEGRPSDQQLDDLDRIVEGIGFDDFDEHLDRFERTVTSKDDFEFLARNMYHPKAKSQITRILWDLALQRGYAGEDEEKLIKKIQAWWKD